MKSHFVLTLLFITSVLYLFSCQSSRTYPIGGYTIEMGVVSEDANGNYFFTLDNGKTLWCTGTPVNRLGVRLNQRVLINYSILNTTRIGYTYNVQLNHLDTILTKKIMLTNSQISDSVGDDPIQIYQAWISGGYVNINYTITGGAKRHILTLVMDTTLSEVRTLQLRHNSQQDSMTNLYAGYISFSLSRIRPFFQEDSIGLSLRYKTKNGVVFMNNIPCNFNR